ncbi:hypothetical protein EV360DRAFT_80562 [Lentinula raphanica]|nr:hypothetical protein EV360DRAFT_80562 [Lentinula raphanica]
MTITIPFVLAIARVREEIRSHAVFSCPVSQVTPCPLLLLPSAPLPLSPPAPAMAPRTLTHSHSRSRPLWLLWLLLAIVSLHGVTLVHVNALPMPLSTGSEAQVQASTEVLPIAVGYYDSTLGRFLAIDEVNELKWAEMQEREGNGGKTGEVGRGEEPKEEGKQTKKKPGPIRDVLKTTYAAVSPGLCFGLEVCFVYQKDSQGLPTIESDLSIHKATVKPSKIGSPSHKSRARYHRPMQVSLVANSDSDTVVSQSVSQTKNSNKHTQTTQAKKTKKALFETFFSLSNLQSALNTHHIHLTHPISSSDSLCSAMLQLMQAMNVLRGNYDKDQTLEQNMMSVWKPFWASLRFGFFGPTVPSGILEWQRYRVKGTVVQPRFVNRDDIRQTESETAETEHAEIEDSETVETKDSPDTMHLCFDAWGTCFILISNEKAEPAILERNLIKRIDRGRITPKLEYHPRVNLRLEEWHVASWAREHHDTKLEMNLMEEGSMPVVPVDELDEKGSATYPKAPVAMDALRKELSNIKLLEKSSGLDISDDNLLIHAILTHLRKTCWLSLTDKELKKNLEKPLLDLIYVDPIKNNPASSSTPSHKRPLERVGQDDTHKSDTTSSHRPSKKPKPDTESRSMPSQPATGAAGSGLRSSTRSSRSEG